MPCPWFRPRIDMPPFRPLLDRWRLTVTEKLPLIDIHIRHRGHTRHPSSSPLSSLETLFLERPCVSRARAHKTTANVYRINSFWPCSPIPGTEGRERCQRRICEYWLNSSNSRFRAPPRDADSARSTRSYIASLFFIFLSFSLSFLPQGCESDRAWLEHSYASRRLFIDNW